MALIGAKIERFDLGIGRVDYLHDDLSACDAGVCPFDAHTLYRIVGRAQARRVDEPVEDAVEVQRGFDEVARRARNFRYQRPLLIEQPIEQGAFSYIGTADDRHGDPLLDGVA